MKTTGIRPSPQSIGVAGSPMLERAERKPKPDSFLYVSFLSFVIDFFVRGCPEFRILPPRPTRNNAGNHMA
jgi:hypothetical protein